MIQLRSSQWREYLTNFDQDENLTAAELDNKIYICLSGRGSFRISPPLKKFIQQKIDNPALTHIFLNMKDCQGMDSTFMGVLAGLACLAKNHPSLKFQLTHLSEKNENLLVTLGVNRVLDYKLQSEKDNSIFEPDAQLQLSMKSDTKTKAEVSLEAHQKLVEIDKKNLIEFKSVIELLQEDLDELNGK